MNVNEVQLALHVLIVKILSVDSLQILNLYKKNYHKINAIIM